MNELRTKIFGLLVACPKDNPEANCPLEEIRRLELKDRLKWLENLSDSDCHNLFEIHQECMIQRQSEEMENE